MESFCCAHFGHWSVHGLPAFQDNYLWAIVNENTKQMIVVDPGCAQTIQRFMTANGLFLSHVWVTHHHPDHIGGLKELTQAQPDKFPQPVVVGTHTGRIEGINQPVADGDQFTLANFKVEVLELPGHTLDHLAFLVRLPDQADWLFCGDTLFSGGCGRLFEGSHAQMHRSLSRLKALAPDTLVFCAHEYTLANLKFLHHFSPNHPGIKDELYRVKSLRENGLSTIPTSIGKELNFNLFLSSQTVDEFKAVRQAKDVF